MGSRSMNKEGNDACHLGEFDIGILSGYAHQNADAAVFTSHLNGPSNTRNGQRRFARNEKRWSDNSLTSTHQDIQALPETIFGISMPHVVSSQWSVWRGCAAPWVTFIGPSARGARQSRAAA